MTSAELPLLAHDRDSRLETDRILALRQQLCPVESCENYDCQLLCDKGCERHGSPVEVNGRMVLLCSRCTATRECASCSKALPKYAMVYTDNCEDGGEWMCPACAHDEPEEF